MVKKLCILFLMVFQIINAQKPLTTEMLEESTFRFTLQDDLTFSEEATSQWDQWIGDNQFVGLAEVHRTTQLSYFTAALLPMLKENGFKNFALELGPNSAEILNEFKSKSGDMGKHIKAINRTYGKNHISKTPLIFVNKKAHAHFMNKASDLDFHFWGLDQEFGFSYEMLVDRIHNLIEKPNKELETKYKKAKKIFHKNIFKNKKRGKPIDCWYPSNIEINDFLDASKSLNPKVEKIVSDIRKSWDVYCKTALGKGGTQLRANYMKNNIDSYLKSDEKAKVFLKFGSAHLTHGISPFGVDDLGKHLHQKAIENNTGFLSIYQIIAYRNGKSMTKDSGWKHLSMFLKLGRKVEWTAIDLRPFREKLIEGKITTNDTYSYKIMNYDILLISPNDAYDKPNY